MVAGAWCAPHWRAPSGTVSRAAASRITIRAGAAAGTTTAVVWNVCRPFTRAAVAVELKRRESTSGCENEQAKDREGRSEKETPRASRRRKKGGESRCRAHFWSRQHIGEAAGGCPRIAFAQRRPHNQRAGQFYFRQADGVGRRGDGAGDERDLPAELPGAFSTERPGFRRRRPSG